MQFSHAFVITPEKGCEILRQVFLVDLGECAHNAEVQRDVSPESGWFNADLNVARVHVGMKKAIAKNLGKKEGDAVTREFGNVNPGRTQTLDLVNGHAPHALHDHHIRHAVVPEHFRDQHQVQVCHVAAQLRGAGGFTYQIQLVVQVLVKLSHHFARFQAFAILGKTLYPTGHHAQQIQVFADHRRHVRAQHLDSDITVHTLFGLEHCKMHLRDRRAGHRL